MVHRHPFPGPGLGVRILGEIHKAHADLPRRADAIFIEELRRHDLYGAAEFRIAPDDRIGSSCRECPDHHQPCNVTITCAS
jgi:hypothetical protein